MGKMVSTIKGVRKDAYFEALLNEDRSAEEKLERLRNEVRFAGVLNTCIPRGNLARKTSKSRITQPAESTRSAAIARNGKSDAPFDPFSVHTTNVYKKEGADGLMTALAAIDCPAHLKSMVLAQRIPVSDLDSLEDAEALRAHIVTAVAERIADRKAAAS